MVTSSEAARRGYETQKRSYEQNKIVLVKGKVVSGNRGDKVYSFTDPSTNLTQSSTNKQFIEGKANAYTESEQNKINEYNKGVYTINAAAMYAQAQSDKQGRLSPSNLPDESTNKNISQGSTTTTNIEGGKLTTTTPQRMGVIMTDFTTGESVKTEYSNDGNRITRTYYISPIEGQNIGMNKAINQIENKSRISSTLNILSSNNLITPTVTTQKSGDITTTTTTYDFNNLEGGKKLVSFQTQTGITSLTIGAGDIIATNKQGEINTFAQGSQIPKGYIKINENAEQLYGDYDQTANELLFNARSTGKFADTKILLGSAVTKANPFGFVMAINIGGYGLNKISKGKLGINSEQYVKETEKIEKETLISVADNNAFTFAIKSPVVQTSAIALGTGLAGGVIKQVGYLATTIPSLAQPSSYAVSATSSFLISNTSTLASVGLPVLGYKTSKDIDAQVLSYQEMGVTTKTGSYITAGAVTGLNYFAFSKGLSSGLKEGLPIVARGVQVDGTTISQGVYFQYSGNPIYTKTATGYSQSGDLIFTKGWGMPNTVALPLNRVNAYTPSGTVETSLYRQYLQSYTPQGINAEAAYQVTTFTYGKTGKVYDESYLKNFFKESGFKSQTNEALNNYFKAQKGYEIYGSTPTAAQVQNYRTPKDLDVAFESVAGKTKANEIIGIINKYEGAGTAKLSEGSTGQILYKGVKKFDIHGTDTPPQFLAVDQPYGFSKLNPVKISGVQTSTLSQEGVNKLSSVGSLQPNNVVSPDLVKRGKDIADFYVIQRELIQTTGGKGSVSSAVQLTTYKESAINYFGASSFNNYPRLVAYSSSSGSSSSASSLPLLPRVSSGSSYLIKPYSSASSTFTSSYTIIPTVSSKISPSPSGSPSLSIVSSYQSYSRRSISPSSISPSVSYSSISPSPSPSISPSVSISSITSPSPSPSISPSVYSYSYNTPPTPPPVFLLRGFSDGLPSNVLGGGKKGTRYTPSFSALVFNIGGKSGKSDKTGLDLRPVTSSFKIKSSLSFLKLRRFLK